MQKMNALKLIVIYNQCQRQNFQRQKEKQRPKFQQKFYQCSHLLKDETLYQINKDVLQIIIR